MRSFSLLRCIQPSTRCLPSGTTPRPLSLSPLHITKNTKFNFSTTTSRTYAMLDSISLNKFDPSNDIPDLSGRVFVVTGGSAGIGYGICAHLLQHNPAKLYLLGKKEEHLAEAEESLAARFNNTGNGIKDCVSFLQVELEDFHDTDRVARQLASDLKEKDGGRLDALILNAGLGVGKYSLTPKDHLDSHMQVNVWSQFHLAMLLWPLLLQTQNSRLLFQSSDFHRMNTSGVEFRNVEEMNQDLGASALYNRTKLAQVLLTHAFARRKQQGKLGMTPGGSPWINACHPGAVSTDQPEQAVEAYGLPGKVGVSLVRPFMKDPIDEGCRSMLFAATSDKVVEDKIDGAYIVPDCKVTEPSKQSKDQELQERCWALTVDVLKGKLGSEKMPYLSEV